MIFVIIAILLFVLFSIFMFYVLLSTYYIKRKIIAIVLIIFSGLLLYVGLDYKIVEFTKYKNSSCEIEYIYKLNTYQYLISNVNDCNKIKYDFYLNTIYLQ
jgi:hypothetical protein